MSADPKTKRIDDLEQQALRRLTADGLIERDGGVLRTTRKWQGAMARAALHLYNTGDESDDLRVPIAYALLQLYGDSLSDEELVACVTGMLPIQARALGRLAGPAR